VSVASIPQFLDICIAAGVVLGLAVAGLLIAAARAGERYEDLSRGDWPGDFL